MSDRKAALLRVEVAYAQPSRQALIAVEVEEGTTVHQAIERSGILGRYPEIEIAPDRVGIFGKLVRLDTVVRHGDRVEIYRPLIANPKQARRERMKKPGKIPRP